MANSIEEDIKILESFSNENVIYSATVGMTLEKYKNLQLSAEHILSDYKKIQKELDEKTTIIFAGAEKVKQLEKENEELSKKVVNNICNGVEEQVLEEYRQEIAKLQAKVNCTELQLNSLKKENELVKQALIKNSGIADERNQLLKENEEFKILKDDLKDKRIVYIDTPEFEESYIPTQKIKNKIEELKEKADRDNVEEYSKISILNELLESEE